MRKARLTTIVVAGMLIVNLAISCAPSGSRTDRDEVSTGGGSTKNPTLAGEPTIQKPSDPDLQKSLLEIRNADSVVSVPFSVGSVKELFGKPLQTVEVKNQFSPSVRRYYLFQDFKVSKFYCPILSLTHLSLFS